MTARTYETRPAEGTPIGGGGEADGVDASNGTFTFVTPSMMMFGGEGGEFSRERIERELAREFGGPASELPADAESVGARLRDSLVLLVSSLRRGGYGVLRVTRARGEWIDVVDDYWAFVWIRWRAHVQSERRGGVRVVLYAQLSCGRGRDPRWDVTARVLTLISVLLSVYIARLVGKFYAILASIPYEGQLLLRQLDWSWR